ncbi:MAG: Wzz/FepE/Etk N-terminal domain-containing protein [Bacilli bacterium]|nr:Wzz/FepE/Etk N-terminal domain-containing protein [Bacilli bacterium]
MEEIDVGQLLGYFKSKIIYIIFAMSIAFCLSSIYVNRFRVPEYTSYTTILLNKTNENSSITSTDLQIDKSLVSTYSEIIKSKRVLRTVINNLALDMEYGTLVSKVNVGSVTDTSILKISVTDSDSSKAASIANEIAEVFSEDIQEIYKIENISIIDVAEITSVASSTSTMKIIGIATIAGAFLSIAVIFVIFYFDTTIKNEEDIERATSLPVIGIVPISREKIKGSAHRKYYEEKAKKHKSQEILPVEREVRRVEVDTKVDSESEISMMRISSSPSKPEDILRDIREELAEDDSEFVSDDVSENYLDSDEETIQEEIENVLPNIEEQEELLDDDVTQAVDEVVNAIEDVEEEIISKKTTKSKNSKAKSSTAKKSSSKKGNTAKNKV